MGILTLFRKHPLSTRPNASLQSKNKAAVDIHFQTTQTQAKDLEKRFYKQGSEIVHLGLIRDERLRSLSEFSYSHVPLGLMVRGSVIVSKGGKATKHLTDGDFIGLFETSDWLSSGHTRNIGDWTLIADAETEIAYFSRTELLSDEMFAAYLIALAKMDPVPQPLTQLPLLDWTASHTTKARLQHTVIVAHTHLLPNNGPLFRHFAHLVGFGNMYVLEKPYSTVPSVKNELVNAGVEIIPVHAEAGIPYELSVQKSIELLWKRLLTDRKTNEFSQLLILDDGGDLWLSIPWQDLKGIRIAGVEQTQRGIARLQRSSLSTPPIVSVATSGIKKMIEAEFIGNSITKKITELGLLNSNKRIGVLGTGAIGRAFIDSVSEQRRKVVYYDPSDSVASQSEGATHSIDALLNESDIIIGTTGTDCLKGVALDRVSGEKILISASSADIEFGSLLKLANPHSDPFGTIDIKVRDDLTFHILNGGYPINFDRKVNATADEDIVLTRSLLYIGLMEAAALAVGNAKPGIYGLDHLAQQKLLERWLSTRQGRLPKICETLSAEQIIDTNNATPEDKLKYSVWVD